MTTTTPTTISPPSRPCSSRHATQGRTASRRRRPVSPSDRRKAEAARIEAELAKIPEKGKDPLREALRAAVKKVRDACSSGKDVHCIRARDALAALLKTRAEQLSAKRGTIFQGLTTAKDVDAAEKVVEDVKALSQRLESHEEGRVGDLVVRSGDRPGEHNLFHGPTGIDFGIFPSVDDALAYARILNDRPDMRVWLADAVRPGADLGADSASRVTPRSSRPASRRSIELLGDDTVALETDAILGLRRPVGWENDPVEVERVHEALLRHLGNDGGLADSALALARKYAAHPFPQGEPAPSVRAPSVRAPEPPPAPAAPKPPPKMWHVEGDKLFGDTDLLRAAGRLPGFNVRHIGFGEFTLETPAGEVEFIRYDGHEWPGAVGRAHLLRGKPEAIQAMVRALGFEEAIAAERANPLPIAPAVPVAPVARSFLTPDDVLAAVAEEPRTAVEVATALGADAQAVYDVLIGSTTTDSVRVVPGKPNRYVSTRGAAVRVGSLEALKRLPKGTKFYLVARAARHRRPPVASWSRCGSTKWA